MRVVHVLSSNAYSGAENVACQIIDMFRDSNNIDMFYCSPDGNIRNTLKKRNIEFYPLGRMSIREMKKMLSALKPDIIHAHDMRASLYSALTCRKIPLISHIHNNAYSSRKLSVKSVAYLYAAKKASHIFWVSNSALNDYFYNKTVSGKSSVLSNIINVDEIRKRATVAINQKPYDIFYIGRLTYPKNPERFIKIIRSVVDLNPDVKCAVVGNGELESAVKQLSNELSLDKNIDYLGFVDNPFGLMKSSKVMVMTSRWEGTPMAALEAMSLSVPLICTPVDGLKNLVINGETGYLSNEDSILVTHILELLTNENERKRLGNNSLEMMRELNNIDVYKSTLRKTYYKALNLST